MKTIRFDSRIFIALASWLCPIFVQAENSSAPEKAEAEYIRSHYVKTDFHVPMRDGVTLFTSVYAPKDGRRNYPILMVRTPYSVAPYGAHDYRNHLGPSQRLAHDGYIFVYQDVRGRFLSQGEFVDIPAHDARTNVSTDIDPSTDANDTISWLLKNVPHNNGRVGTWGVSYPGFYSVFSLMNPHPALAAASPQAPMADVGDGDDAYHNGAYFLAANFDFYAGFYPRGLKPKTEDKSPGFEFSTEDAYAFYLRMGVLSNAQSICFKNANPYWDAMLAHPNYDQFWANRALAPDIRPLAVPVLLVGGWFDAEDLGGVFKLFHALETNCVAPGLTLVMGPWSHGQWADHDGQTLGDLNFGSKTAEFFRDKIEQPFFQQALKNGAPAKLPTAWMFETGKNIWRKFEQWPPAQAEARALYLQSDGGLDFAPDKIMGTDEYTSDPAKPVPLMDRIGEGMPGDYMTYDQRFASQRTDVLTYQTAPLSHDVILAGPVKPSLLVATSGTDSDFIVKLIDVYPDDTPDPSPNPHRVHFGGYQQLVRGEPFRGKFRHDRTRPEPFVPGQPDRLEFIMPDILHNFRKGHRIMVQVQSSWFPLIDRNPQRFENIPTAGPGDFQKAVEKIGRGGGNGSRVDVMVLPP